MAVHPLFLLKTRSRLEASASVHFRALASHCLDMFDLAYWGLTSLARARIRFLGICFLSYDSENILTAMKPVISASLKY